jgi:hypothetical protein
MKYDRLVVGYHGCDAAVAERLLRGERFRPSQNDYDWLGHGIYFWEFGYDRALQFANEQRTRGKVKEPTVVGALIQLGNCFDLMDVRFTTLLGSLYPPWRASLDARGTQLPRNDGKTEDLLLRRLDCAVVNWAMDVLKVDEGVEYDVVRGGFVEGGPCFEGSGIRRQSHVQVSVRNPRCIVGVFRPMMEAYGSV